MKRPTVLLLLLALCSQVPAVRAEPITRYCPLLGGEKAALHGLKLSGKAQLFEQGKDHYRIGCGCALVQCNSPAVRIDTCHASVFALKGASFVVDNGGATSIDRKDDSLSVKLPNSITRVLNLSDKRRDSVRVVLGKRHLTLNPGEELVVVKGNMEQAERLIQYSTIKFRRPKVSALSEDTQLVVFEFSLGDALKNCAIFKQLSSSPMESDHRLLKDLIKTAAAVNTMFAKSREKYTENGKETAPVTQTADTSRRM